jgi:hypothetical protein
VEHWKTVRDEMFWIARGTSRKRRRWYNLRIGGEQRIVISSVQSRDLSPDRALVILRISVVYLNERLAFGLPGGSRSGTAVAEFVDKREVVRIGGLWYLVSPFWTGKCTAATRRGECIFACKKCGYSLESGVAMPDMPGWVTCPECGRECLAPPGFEGRTPGAPPPPLPDPILNLGPASPLVRPKPEYVLPPLPPEKP